MTLSFLTGYVMGRKDAAAGALRAASVPGVARSDAEDLLDLHERIDRLILVVGAMSALLEDDGVITEDELTDRIRELDEADGTADGKRTAAPSQCQSCDAAVPAGLDACQFCGAAVAPAAQPGPLDSV